MTGDPVLDGRSREQLLEELRALADNYTEDWDPYSSDSGTTVLRIFSRFQRDVVRRLEGVPEKQRQAFFDALGFNRRPPQPPRVPLTFKTTSDIDDNVVVPGGTQAVADTEAGSSIFEIPNDGGFEATPASLEEVVGVDPADDSIFDHGLSFSEDAETTLFSGEDRQDHVLYLGHDDLLNLDPGSTVTIRILTNATEAALTENVIWEFYGVKDDGSTGWLPLPQRTTDISDRFSSPDADLGELRTIVRERIQEFSSTDVTEWGNNPFELSFTLPTATADCSVNDIASRWIRGRAGGDDPSIFDIEIESISLNVERESETGGMPPDNALANDVPLAVDGADDVFPFGRFPQPPTTLYLGAEEVFTKKGGTVTVRFEPPAEGPVPSEAGDDTSSDDGGDRSQPLGGGILGGAPEISWEYWNGNGWAKLRLQDDSTGDFMGAGEVRFVVPSDLAVTSVSGHEDYWIRARLVSGNYGQPRYEITDDGGRGELVDQPNPPRFGGISLGYDQRGEDFQHVFTHNNLASQEVTPDDRDRAITPYERLPEDRQTLYLGFSDPLREGPITLYVPAVDETYPRTFEPDVRWEYCVDPDRDRWAKLGAQDGTEGLTERGIVSFNFPEETRAFDRFGLRTHWIRARVRGDQFDPDVSRERDRGNSTPDGPTPGTDRRTNGSRPAPQLSGIHPNTQWAHNVRTIEREVLGSSDGTHDQSFTCAHPPITDIDVWVNELSTLSARERRELAQERPEEVNPVPQSASDPVEFWIRWTEVSDFFDSSEASRHYTVDRIRGTVTFGDGEQGAIPPISDDNIRVSYKTSGRLDGTIPPGTITELKSPISLIDSVTNIEPSDTGADVESIDTVVSRAPNRIKSRGRAVTVTDFEHVAKEASRELAKVRCEPERDDTGSSTPGWVTLLVVPQEQRARPSPSVEQKVRVQRGVQDRAPASLAGVDSERIIVRGPHYVAISVETTIAASGIESVSTLKESIEGRLDRYFHPLTGGVNGEGWDFGESPDLARISSLITATDGVDAVMDAVMAVSMRDEAIKLTETDDPPTLRRDALVCSGSHEVTVTIPGRTDR